MNEDTEDTLITIDLTNDELLTLCLMAHEEDITLNALVNEILAGYAIEYINDLEEREEEKMSEKERLEDENIGELKSFQSFFYSFTDFAKLCDALYYMMPLVDRRSLYKITEDNFDQYLAEMHLTYGRWLRNTLNLWDEDTPIVKWFNNTYKITHADDISSIIIAGIVFRDRLVIRNRIIVRLVKEFHEHWNAMQRASDRIHNIE